MSENLPQGSDGVPHYCPYVGCRCLNKYLTRRYCREFENGNQIQSLVYFSKAAKWDASRLQEVSAVSNAEFHQLSLTDQQPPLCIVKANINKKFKENAENNA